MAPKLRLSYFIILAIPAILLFCLGGQKKTASSSGDPVVAVINGLPVSEAEYRLVMNTKAAEVIAEFHRTQGWEDHAGYWSERAGPGAPIFRLRKMTCDELVRIKVVQELAKEKGLLPDPSFAEFQAALERENARRRDVGRSGGTIYGPVQYERTSYYFIRQGDLDYKVSRILADEILKEISDSAIAGFHRENFQNDSSLPSGERKERIRRILAEQEAARRIEALCKSARMTIKEDRLRLIAPRVDPGFEIEKKG